MEYDNDRRLPPTHRTEIFCWVLLAVLNPLVNSLTIFWMDRRIWLPLFFISLIVFPAYVIYARIIVPRFLFRHRYFSFTILSVIFFVSIQALLTAVYALILKSEPLLIEQSYFSYKTGTVVREGLWTLINMFLSIGIAFFRKATDEEELLTNVQKDNRAYKLKYLQSQLNPHFLFNTLNSIYSLSLQQSEKTPEVVVKLADLMRYLIYECNHPRVLLNKEIEFIRNYIEIEGIRHKADIRFNVEGVTDNILIEPFLFMSFIENGFKHALNDAYIVPFIYITLKVNEQQIMLTVINNSNLDLATQAKRINGTGIRNSRNMLEILYPDTYSLNIIQTEKQKRSESLVRLRNARQRLEMLYPDSHELDIILGNNAFTVSLIVKPVHYDKMYHSR